MGMAPSPIDRTHHGHAMDAVRVALGEQGFATAWAEGQGLAMEAAIALALPEGEETDRSQEQGAPLPTDDR